MSKVILSVGRVAEVKRANATLKCNVGHWSTLLQIKEKNADAPGPAKKGLGADRATRSCKVLTIASYALREDAWEESAYLNGKRPLETKSMTKARRDRSLCGIIDVPMTLMGAMGVGLETGENNVLGTKESSGITSSLLSDEDAALQAVEGIKASLVGAETLHFPRIQLDNSCTLSRAIVQSVDKSHATVQFITDAGAADGSVQLALAEARNIFTASDDPFGSAVQKEGWPNLSFWTSRMAPAFTDASGGISLRVVLMLAAVLGVVSGGEVVALAALDAVSMSEQLLLKPRQH